MFTISSSNYTRKSNHLLRALLAHTLALAVGVELRCYVKEAPWIDLERGAIAIAVRYIDMARVLRVPGVVVYALCLIPSALIEVWTFLVVRVGANIAGPHVGFQTSISL